ncbi:raffinose/stachyose/melibiose transport system substrate-binding protein [Paenibacillus shirakamiensis]|uniref:Raffinose/stachyose/melibiose transport system substrate-binding protein n=1 Tax=Paenibacillus shirakamiensis TaxID=1265935 RepID=A0ABS4JCI1_9BACL|nr:extracellular solute-binding protein [Paenibacillus shirakamiensis]MBP1999403.1 raffinose/stachyose/melibiose transport system substrate-binding protein [Paenibacillus shirakamiensis]
MKKSLVLLLSLMMVSTTLLTACGGKDESEKAPTTPSTETPTKVDDSPFELTLRHTQVGADKAKRLAILQDVVKATQEENKGLTIKLDGVESDVNRKEKLRGEMAAGNPPDIFDLFGSPDSKVYAKEGKLLDLTPILSELGLSDKFSSLAPFTYEGKIYGLPVGGSAEGIFYNKEYFTQKGLKVPTNWAEFEDLLAKIKADGKTPFAAASKAGWVPLMLANHLWSRYAGSDVTEKFATGKAKWSDPNVVKGFAKYAEWEKKGYFKKGELGFEYAEYTTQFTSGEVPLLYDGTWKSSVFKKGQSGEKLIGKVGFFNLPAVDGGEGDQTALMRDVNNGYGFSASVASDPKKLAAVKSFIKHYFSEDMVLRGLTEDGVLPAMKIDDAKLTEATKSDALLQDIVSVLNSSKSSFPAFDSLVQGPVTTEISNIQIQKLIGGQTTPEKMGEELQKVQEEANADNE